MHLAGVTGEWVWHEAGSDRCYGCYQDSAGVDTTKTSVDEVDDGVDDVVERRLDKLVSW